jgi:MGT family glycosyltransferase
VAELGEVPQNVEVGPFLPQLDVLRHAQVFLSHTGMNSTMEALYLGVPIVAFPLQPEQEANARRVDDLGLGRRLPADGLTPGMIYDVVTEVSQDQQIRRNIAAMSPRVGNSGGATAAAYAMEEYLGTLAQRRV